MTADLLLFYLLAAGMVLSAALMVASRNVIHAVIAMVANFALTGVLYLLLHAPFLFVVQITYAGAIMVLFLFVVMIPAARRVDGRAAGSATRRGGGDPGGLVPGGTCRRTRRRRCRRRVLPDSVRRAIGRAVLASCCPELVSLLSWPRCSVRW
jgi:uncharacterized MnhB-related membrane protein